MSKPMMNCLVDTLTTHELAKELLELEDKPLEISVDMSTCDEDSENRVFTTEYFGVNDKHASEITLLFAGEPNY